MSQTDYLALGMGGPTILMSDGDIANNIRGYAVQALEECVFSQFDLNMAPLCSFGKKMPITAVTNASNEFTLASTDIATLAVGDKVLLNWGGADMPTSSTLDSEGRGTDWKDKSIYWVQAIDTGTNEIKLEEQKGAGAIGLANDGTIYADTWIAKAADPEFSHGQFTRNASANDTKMEIVGSVDGRVFKTDDDGGLQVNMFDTTGTATVGDVKLPEGVTVYLPVTDITLTTGACIVYTKSI